MIKFIISIILVTLLTGCSLFEPRIVIQTKLITPEDSLLLDCDVTPPPSRNSYVAGSMAERETMLVGYSSALIKDCFVCNEKLKALRKWKKDSIDVVDKQNKDNK